MHINLTGQHMDITDSLRDYVTEKMSRLERTLITSPNHTLF